MNYEYSEIVDILRKEIKNKANEISHRLDEDETYEIRELLNFVDELEDKLSNFDNIIETAWENCDVF